MSCFVVQFDPRRAEELKEYLALHSFTFSTPAHTHFQGKKKGLSCTLYTSGKLMVQGKGTEDFVKFNLEPDILGTFTYGYDSLDLTPRIGIDESGKGDFFGPLCIAGVYGDSTTIPYLKEIGVKDSKRIKDPSILKIASKIRARLPHHIIRIGPSRYNELYDKFGNLNLLLGWGHATAIEKLLEKAPCELVIIDQFAAEHVVENALRKKSKRATLTQRTKAEQDLVVAAASILARAAFVEGLAALEKEAGLKLPKGASAATIAAGKQLVERYGAAILLKMAKMHFKTKEAIL